MSPGRSGSSIGWVVTQTCSRTYSDGARFRCGTSSRRCFQCLSSRQHSAGSQAKPPSTRTTFRLGMCLEHALTDQAGDQGLHGLDIGRMFLVVEGRPAAAG